MRVGFQKDTWKDVQTHSSTYIEVVPTKPYKLWIIAVFNYHLVSIVDESNLKSSYQIKHIYHIISYQKWYTWTKILILNLRIYLQELSTTIESYILWTTIISKANNKYRAQKDENWPR